MSAARKKLTQAVSRSLASAGAASAKMQPLAVAALNVATDTTKKAAKDVAQYAADHPVIATAVVTGTVLTLAPQLATIPILQAVGFGAEGVAAGSAAAAAQSGMGNVVAGSLFSTLQSAGAGGAGAAVVNGVVQGVVSGVAAAAAGGRFLWSKARGERGSSEKQKEVEDSAGSG